MELNLDFDIPFKKEGVFTVLRALKVSPETDASLKKLESAGVHVPDFIRMVLDKAIPYAMKRAQAMKPKQTP